MALHFFDKKQAFSSELRSPLLQDEEKESSVSMLVSAAALAAAEPLSASASGNSIAEKKLKPADLQKEFLKILETNFKFETDFTLFPKLKGDTPLRASFDVIGKDSRGLIGFENFPPLIQFLEAHGSELNLLSTGPTEHKSLFHYLIHLAYIFKYYFSLPKNILLLPNLPWDVPYGNDFAKKWGIYHDKINLENATPLWMLLKSFNYKPTLDTWTQLVSMQKLNFFAKSQGITVLQILADSRKELYIEDDMHYYPVEYLLLKCSQHLELDRIIAEIVLPKEQQARHHFAYWLAKAEHALAQPLAQSEEKEQDDPFTICMAKADSFRLQAIKDYLFNADYLMALLYIKKIQKNPTPLDLENYIKHIFAMRSVTKQYHTARDKLAHELTEPNSIFKNHFSEAERQQKAYELLLKSGRKYYPIQYENHLQTVKAVADFVVKQPVAEEPYAVDAAREAERLLVEPGEAARKKGIEYLIKYKKADTRVRELEVEVQRLKLNSSPSAFKPYKATAN